MRPWAGLAFALVLAGCGAEDSPTGQVVASVDGVEITRREVLLEIELAGLPPGVPAGDAERIALDRLIERKLLLAGARQMQIDRGPDFQIRARRNRELDLADRLTARLRAQQPEPDAAAIARHIAAYPRRFAERRQIVLDRIVADGIPADAGPLAAARSNDTIATLLAARGVAFSRGLALVDTADDDAPASVGAMGATTITRDGTGFRADVALLTRAVVLPRPAQEALARAQIIAIATQAALGTDLARRRRAARIVEQPKPKKPGA